MWEVSTWWRDLPYMRRAYLVFLSLEWAVILASVKLAALLLTHPTFFDSRPDSFGMISQSHMSSEWDWGLLAATAATMKLVGLLLIRLGRTRPRVFEWSYYIRQIGWFLSALLWGAFSASSLWGNFNSVGASGALALLAISIGVMLMGPFMPESDNPGTPRQ